MRFVTRQAWGARPAKLSVPLDPALIRGIVFHYSGMDADEQSNHANCANRVRGIQRFHMDTRGWQDIAYSWLVCKHGYVFEGRGFGVRTAATGSANGSTLAVCFLGDDTTGRDDVTIEGRQGLAEIATAFFKRYPNATGITGHKDHMATACPGGEIYTYVTSDAFRKLVTFDDTARLATLRRWILARHAEGWSWERIKRSANWREYLRRGGK